MFLVKRDSLTILKIPLSEKLFGKNKTYRGFLFVGLTTAIFQLLFNSFLYGSTSLDSFNLGLTLGIVYMLFELPNSFLKRRLKIKSGTKSTNHPCFFTILDKVDSTFGVCLAFVLIKGLEFKFLLLFFFCAFVVHFLVSKILFKFNIKESL
jgi:hypothetical protein